MNLSVFSISDISVFLLFSLRQERLNFIVHHYSLMTIIIIAFFHGALTTQLASYSLIHLIFILSFFLLIPRSISIL